MKRIRIFAVIVVFAIASGAVLAQAGAPENKERTLFNGITFFGASHEPACAGQAGSMASDPGSSVRLFNGITYFDRSTAKIASADVQVNFAELPGNGITVFR